MKNDYQLLPLKQLAQDYQQEFQRLLEQETQELQALALRRQEQLVQFRVQQLTAAGEEGSDGVEEWVRETLGNPKPLQVDQAKLRQQAREAVTSRWIEQNQIAQKLSYFPHQWMSYFGGWQAIKVGDKYSPRQTYQHNVVEPQDLFALGSVLLARSNRSNFFKAAPKTVKQYSSPINPLVPVVLAGFKRCQNIPYSAWDLSELDVFENEEIVKLVNCTKPDVTASRLLSLRNVALTPQSGARAGKPSNPATSANLYHLGDTEIGHLPRLAKYIVLQTWAAHPQHRDPYAILDLDNWDHVPEPLIVADVFVPETKQPTFTFTSANKLLWD